MKMNRKDGDGADVCDVLDASSNKVRHVDFGNLKPADRPVDFSVQMQVKCETIEHST